MDEWVPATAVIGLVFLARLALDRALAPLAAMLERRHEEEP